MKHHIEIGTLSVNRSLCQIIKLENQDWNMHMFECEVINFTVEFSRSIIWHNERFVVVNIDDVKNASTKLFFVKIKTF